MAFINRLSVDEVTGRAFVTTDAPSSTAPYMAGIRFVDDGTMCVQNVAVGGTATFEDGYARDDNGILYVRIDDPPTGSSAVYNDGILGDITGRMSMTTTNPIAGYSHGWPVDAVGSVCIIGVTPPPPTLQTFDTLFITANSPEISSLVDNLRFGTATAGGGFTTNQATFLSDNPGLTLQTFEGITTDSGFETPAHGIALSPPNFAGFTVVAAPLTVDTGVAGKDVLPTPSAVLIYSGTLGSPTSLVFTFTPKVSAVGLNLSAGAVGGNLTFTVKDGATTITTQVVSTVSYSTFTSFAGYASSPVVSTQNRITGDSENRITADGDNRVWV